MNKKIRLPVALTIILTLFLTIITSCSEKASHSEFFAWMDAYIAVEENVTNSIAVTMFYEEAPFASTDITNISFIGLQNEVNIEQFQVKQNKQVSLNYSSYVITLDYKALKRGMFQTSGITITTKSKGEVKYQLVNGLSM